MKTATDVEKLCNKKLKRVYKQVRKGHYPGDFTPEALRVLFAKESDAPLLDFNKEREKKLRTLTQEVGGLGRIACESMNCRCFAGCSSSHCLGIEHWNKPRVAADLCETLRVLCCSPHHSRSVE